MNGKGKFFNKSMQSSTSKKTLNHSKSVSKTPKASEKIKIKLKPKATNTTIMETFTKLLGKELEKDNTKVEVLKLTGLRFTKEVLKNVANGIKSN